MAMNRIESHAPWTNFVDVMTMSTMPVVIAPIVLITIERRHPRLRVRALVLLLEPVPNHARLRQRERREHADHVELDQLRQVRVEGDDDHARERTPGTITPFEKTSRSPRFMNWRGMKRSRARIDDRRGKSWYAVFAARIRIEAVKN